jgi:hypothetical protein
MRSYEFALRWHLLSLARIGRRHYDERYQRYRAIWKARRDETIAQSAEEYEKWEPTTQSMCPAPSVTR